jgi:hypothetical protein
MTTTPRLALPQPIAGDQINVNPLAFNTLFTNLDKSVGFTVCTSGTKPGSPFSCQLIYLTDLNQMQIWDSTISAWVSLNPRPMGIMAATGGGLPVTVGAFGTKYMGATLVGVPLEGLRNYRIHVEGFLTWASSKTVATQNTAVGEIFLHTDNSGTATVASTATHLNYCDAYGSPNASSQLVAANFTVDGDFTPPSSQVGATNTYGLGWSFQFGTALPPNASTIQITNTLFYVESV